MTKRYMIQLGIVFEGDLDEDKKWVFDRTREQYGTPVEDITHGDLLVGILCQFFAGNTEGEIKYCYAKEVSPK